MSKLILNVLPVPLIFISFRCFDKFFIEHMGIQFILFTILAGIPSTITGCMFYVDVAWPWGLVALSIFSHTSDWGDNTNSLRQTLACGMMFLHGIRMALGGTFMILSGVWSPKKGDIQRYEYQKIRYKKEGKTWSWFSMQIEVYTQMVANSFLLNVPIFLACSNSDPTIHFVEYVGCAIWVFGYVIESIADVQKLAFIEDCKKKKIRNACCQSGLWWYSRHPNYFGEWVAWWGHAVLAFPSLLSFRETNTVTSTMTPLLSFMDAHIEFLLAFALAYVIGGMYYCLVTFTGAEPAEHFSAIKRPAYKDYQKTTNILIPWFPKALRIDKSN